MIVVYNNYTGNWVNIASGKTTQLESVKRSFPEQAEWLAEICWPDDSGVLANPYGFRLLYFKGTPYRMVKKIKAVIEADKYVLIGDGIDKVHLVVKIDKNTAHPLDNLTKIVIAINDTLIDLEVVDFQAETDLTIQSPPTTLKISLDYNNFASDVCFIEVI